MANWAYDLEIFKNCFTATFIDVNSINIQDYIDADIKKDITAKKTALSKINHKIFIVYNETNNCRLLYDFIISKNCEMLVGYNNHHYDDVILDYIIQHRLYLLDSITITSKLYALSQDILGYIGKYRKDNNIRYSGKYFSIDLMKLHYLDKKPRVSLKQVSILLRWYRLEEYSMPPIAEIESADYYNGNFPELNSFDRYVCDEHIADIIEYNINDVLITLALYDYSATEFKNRIIASKKYKLNLYSVSRSSMADMIMSKFYADATGLSYWDFANLRTYRRSIKFKDIILDEIDFKTPELQSFLEDLKTRTIRIGTDTFKETLIFKGKGYTFAKGGLHSIDHGAVYTETDKYYIRDVDADSYYPSGVVNWKIKADHLGGIIIDIIDHHRKERIDAKHKGDKDTADIGKIVLNSGVFGKLGFEYSWMFDLKAMYKVTINLQLLLIVLIEDLELNGIEVISANTDGIISKIPKHLNDTYEKLCKDWGIRFNMGIEFTDYDLYVRTTVNDYMARTKSGKIKLKGDFLYKLEGNAPLRKGYNAPCIAKALEQYYGHDKTNIDELIKSFDIYDYLISVKVGRKYITEYHTIDGSDRHIKVLQRNNRYFVSNSGGTILKYDKETRKHTNIIARKTVTIFNDYYESNDYNINYNYYKSRLIDMINKINNQITKDMKKNIGNLFNDL